MSTPIDALIEAAMQDRPKAPQLTLTDDQIIARLKEAHEQLSEPTPDFQPGDIVQLKPALRSQRTMRAQPMLFMGFLDKPINPTDLIGFEDLGGNGAAYFVQDCRVGQMIANKDGAERLVYWLESTRDLQYYEPAAEKPATEDTTPAETDNPDQLSGFATEPAE
ncbi:MAG: hypothetical protein AAGK37_19265 [Pseudomonadota bacterium]